jgi:hypothetical protein
MLIVSAAILSVSAGARADDAAPAQIPVVHATDYDAAGLIAALTASGVKMAPVKGKKSLRTVSVTALDCESSTNANLDTTDPTAGIPRQSCTATVAGKKGFVLRESQWLISALGAIKIVPDCAMSHCKLTAKAVMCTIDTSVDSFTGKNRWQCDVTDPSLVDNDATR